jgi:hypothetical protein
MPETRDPHDPTDTPLGLWADFMSKMMGTTWGLSSNGSSTETMRQARTAAFDSWSDYCDQFMRSPMFLDSIRRWLEFNTQSRKQMSEWLGQWQHQMQGASRQDVDQIMRGLRHLEHRMSDGMERICGMLDDLSDRLDVLEHRITDEDSEPLEGSDLPAAESPARRRRRK